MTGKRWVVVSLVLFRVAGMWCKGSERLATARPSSSQARLVVKDRRVEQTSLAEASASAGPRVWTLLPVGPSSVPPSFFFALVVRRRPQPFGQWRLHLSPLLCATWRPWSVPGRGHHAVKAEGTDPKQECGRLAAKSEAIRQLFGTATSRVPTVFEGYHWFDPRVSGNTVQIVTMLAQGPGTYL
ncbi:hypothetical protein CSPX01_11649 [Colletotrichum filicis]|nr:hypothetical protein CSPX01_11649 [Colletotrichum filicis]